MTGISRFKDTIEKGRNYVNFSEDVTIVRETKAGSGYSMYTVTNKNGVTFQVVPGEAGIKDKATMGYVNGDRGRPLVFGPAVKATNTSSAATDPFTEETTADTTDDPGDKTKTAQAKTVSWTIRATSKGVCSDVVTKTTFITVEVL
jgi:hypothetical protein